ncbi:MAG: hypothetical protein WC412_07015 [Candidatus Omnitrophota bacterium]
MNLDPTAVIGGASSVLGAAQAPASSSTAVAEAGSNMYGNFSTGEFTLGGMNSNTLILAAIAAITIAVIFYNKKKHK